MRWREDREERRREEQCVNAGIVRGGRETRERPRTRVAKRCLYREFCVESPYTTNQIPREKSAAKSERKAIEQVYEPNAERREEGKSRESRCKMYARERRKERVHRENIESESVQAYVPEREEERERKCNYL